MLSADADVEWLSGMLYVRLYAEIFIKSSLTMPNLINHLYKTKSYKMFLMCFGRKNNGIFKIYFGGERGIYNFKMEQKKAGDVHLRLMRCLETAFDFVPS